MWTPALLKALIAVITLAGSAAEPKKLDADTLEMVESFLKLPIEKMPPEHTGRFVAVKAEQLPEKLRTKFEARKLELFTLKQMAANKKRGYIRSPEKDCAVPEETRAGGAGAYKLAGYVEIPEDEVEFLMKRTKCTLDELMCEFSLRITVEEKLVKKVKKKFRVNLLHGNDPLNALLSEYRTAGESRNTNFFGGMVPTCNK
jgi:hypothetical protein